MLFKKFITFTIMALLSQSLLAQTFGYHGRNGSDGRNARNGRAGEDVRVYAEQGAQYLDLRGEDSPYESENGEQGYDASSCYQPKEFQSVVGAHGGNGGDGGNGGNGGNGGDALIFYQDHSELRNITILNSPGEGSPGAYAGYGGRGCFCDVRRWTKRVCWQDEECKMEEVCTIKTVPVCRVVNGKKVCTDKKVKECKNVRKCHPIKKCENRTYYCEDGRTGLNGSAGRSGSRGSRGSITLVKGLESIPRESTSSQVAISTLERADTTLSKNIWTTRSGAKSLFSHNSDIADNYSEYVQTNTHSFSLVWSANRSINEFSQARASLSFDGYSSQAGIQTDDLLKYEVFKGSNSTQIVVSGAYKKGETNQLSVSHSGRKKGFVLSVRDQASLFKSLKNKVYLKLEFKRLLDHKTIFEGYVPENKLVITDGEIKIKAGEISSDTDKLKDGKKIRYQVVIERTYGQGSNRVDLGRKEVKL